MSQENPGRLSSEDDYVLEIRRGNGAPKHLTLAAGTPIQPISIGMTGEFRLEADGVLDVHGYLYYDGHTLFVQSADGHHLIRVNGKPIGSEWTAVSPPCTVALGDARLVYCPASQASAAASGPVVARPAAGRAPPPAFDESAPTVADLRYEDYDDAVTTGKTRAPDDEATGSIPIPPAPPRQRHGEAYEDDNETTRALPLPVMTASFAARPPPPPPPPPQMPIAAPPAQLVTAAKQSPLAQLKEGWKQASLPKKAIACLLPVAFVMVIFGLDDNTTPAEAPAPAASTSTTSKPKSKPTATEEPEDLDPPKKKTVDPPPPKKIADPPPKKTADTPPVAMAKDKTAERVAVDAVAAGAWDPAAKAYDDLAKQHPENPAYKEAARILRAKAKK